MNPFVQLEWQCLTTIICAHLLKPCHQRYLTTKTVKATWQTNGLAVKLSQTTQWGNQSNDNVACSSDGFGSPQEFLTLQVVSSSLFNSWLLWHLRSVSFSITLKILLHQQFPLLVIKTILWIMTTVSNAKNWRIKYSRHNLESEILTSSYIPDYQLW